MLNPYETKKLLSEYLLFHYGSAEEILGRTPIPREALDFPARCVRELADFAALPAEARALDVGCAVGRSTFELCRSCPEVLGIDSSETFVEAAGLLRERGTLATEIALEGDLSEEVALRVPEGVDRARAHFRVGDAMELPEDLGVFELVLGANLVCRLPEPRRFLRQLPRLVKPGGQLLLTTPFTWLEQFTPRSQWLGGRREEKIRSADALKTILEPDFELQLTRDLPFVIREHERKFQFGIALGWRWLRR